MGIFEENSSFQFFSLCNVAWFCFYFLFSHFFDFPKWIEAMNECAMKFPELKNRGAILVIDNHRIHFIKDGKDALGEINFS